MCHIFLIFFIKTFSLTICVFLNDVFLMLSLDPPMTLNNGQIQPFFLIMWINLFSNQLTSQFWTNNRIWQLNWMQCVFTYILNMGFFPPIFSCNHIGIHSQEELTKFGYRSKRKVENLKNLAMFWWHVETYCLNMEILGKIFLKICGTFLPKISFVLYHIRFFCYHTMKICHANNNNNNIVISYT